MFPNILFWERKLTGIKARIVVAVGDRFPMIDCHKVLAAYGCLIPRLMSGAFDATPAPCGFGPLQAIIAVAASRSLRCLDAVRRRPSEGMSRERFDWLNKWLADPGEIYRTPGTESNVKEIYDACHKLSQSPENLILNQFAEYGNYIIHRAVTARRWSGYFAI